MTLQINIIGGGQVGRTLATRLTRRGDDVRIIEQDETQRDEIQASGARFVHGDGTDVGTLDEADTSSVDVFATATGDDDTNLLASQLALTRFDVDRIVARVNRDGNVEPFRDLGITPVPVSEATTRELVNRIERPSFTGFVEELSHSGDAQEIEIRNPEYDGVTVGELDESLPEQCLVIIISHEQVTQFPDADLALELNDRITVIGERSAVATARDILNPDGTDRSVPETPPS